MDGQPINHTFGGGVEAETGSAKVPLTRAEESLGKQDAMNRILRALHRWPKHSLQVLGYVLLILVGVSDYLTEPQLGFSIFYLIPISIFAWFFGSYYGVAMSIGSALAWLGADLLWDVPYQHPLIPYWNAFVRLGLFMTIALLLSTLRNLHDQQEQLIQDRTETLRQQLVALTRAHEAVLRSERRFKTVFAHLFQDKRQEADDENAGPASSPGPLADLAQRINAVTDQMERSVTNIFQFSSFVSHELRSPLSIMRNELEEALNSETSSDRLQTVLVSMHNEVLGMSRLVDDLLNLHSAAAGTFRLEKKLTGLRTFLQDFYDEAMLLAREKNISVVLGACPEICLDLDVARMRQVFFNLLDNSLKHTPPQGRIRIMCRTEEGCAVILFSDTGKGIPADDLPKVFEPFFKARSFSSDSRGVGLGLTIAKMIVAAHNGSIQVESAFDRGTQVVIRLPFPTEAGE